MDNSSTLLIILAVFTGIIALVLLVQGFALVAIYRRISDLSERMEATTGRLAKGIEAVAGKADHFFEVLTTTTEKVQALQEDVSAIAGVVHNRVVAMDAFLEEATNMARFQVARFQNVLDSTSRKIDETIDVMQGTILTPIAEIQALIRGVRTGLDVLFGRRRLSANRSHEDEEMFI